METLPPRGIVRQPFLAQKSAGAVCPLGLVGPAGVTEELGDVVSDELLVDGGHGVLLDSGWF
jgi:hypothetical protein